MISNVIGSGLSLLASYSFTDLLQVILNPAALITTLFYTISLFINCAIYSLAAIAYTLFPIMCQLDFSSLTPALQNIISRLEVFIGIFMLFIVAFNLLQYLVDPDKKAGATSDLIKKIIISLILLVSSSFIFGILDSLQEALIDKGKDNIAQTVFFGEAKDSSTTDEETGKRIVYAVFFSMYENQHYGEKHGYTAEYDEIVNGQNPLNIIAHLWFTPETYKKVYYHYPFLAEVFGILLIIMFGTFAIDIGVRNFTLLFLRILFPIAAIGYIVPKKGEAILTKYISTYISTYVQIFVKTFTIYLLLYLFLWFMSALSSAESVIFKDMELGDTTKTLILLIVMVALFLFFTKGMPAILKDVFGINTDSSLKGAFGKVLGLAAAGASLAAGGLLGAALGGKTSGVKGALKGALAGAKGGAQAGWNAGKNIGSGNIGAGITGYGKGMAGMYGGINKASKATADKIEQDAKDAEDKLDNIKDSVNKETGILKGNIDKEEGILKGMNPNDAGYAAQKEKVDNLRKQYKDAQESGKMRIQSAQDDAIKKVQAAQKVNPNYKPKAVGNAEQAASDFKSKSAAASNAREKANSIVTAAEANYTSKQAAASEARKTADELKIQNTEYSQANAEATKLEAAATEARKTADELKISNPGKYEQANAEATKLETAASEARKSANEIISGDANYVQANAEATKLESAATEAYAKYQNIESDSNYQMANAEAEILEKSAQAAFSKAQATEAEAQKWDSSYSSSLPGEVKFEKKTPSKSQTVTRESSSEKETVVEKESERIKPEDANIPKKQSTEESNNGDEQSYNDQRQTAEQYDKLMREEYEKLRQKTLEARRESLNSSDSTPIVELFENNSETDSEEGNDDNSEILKINEETNEQETTVQTSDDELESLIDNDDRAYGKKASDRFRKLVDEQRMDAVLAMRIANQEAHDEILSIARNLVKEGYSPRDAYNEARRRYNDGE